MGPGLADGIAQGEAAGSEFRTAPLWGLGQRIFFLHDGRTSDLVEAIQDHQSGTHAQRQCVGSQRGRDALQRAARKRQKQDLLNFLRSL